MGGGGGGGGGDYKEVWFYQLSWRCNLASKAVVSNVGPSSERIVELWALYSL